MQNNGQITVEEGRRGGRLDAFLAEQMPDVSRSQWKSLIQEGQVQVHGAPCKPNQKL